MDFEEERSRILVRQEPVVNTFANLIACIGSDFLGGLHFRLGEVVYDVSFED